MPLEAVALTTERHPEGLLPTLPGKAPGVVAVRQGPRGNIYTLQCQQCYITEEPLHLTSMTIHFHARSRDGENPRLCRGCRVAAYPDCICDYCAEDRTSRRMTSGDAE
jgi:hypothetical protein